MSQGKVIGPGTVIGGGAVTLPVTGDSTVTLVLVAVAMIIGGLLLVRAGRLRRTES